MNKEEELKNCGNDFLCHFIVEAKYALNPHSMDPVISADLPQDVRDKITDALVNTQNTSLAQQALAVAEVLHASGEFDASLKISELVPSLIPATDLAQTPLLGKAATLQARALEHTASPADAARAFALAEHLQVMTGRIMR